MTNYPHDELKPGTVLRFELERQTIYEQEGYAPAERRTIQDAVVEGPLEHKPGKYGVRLRKSRRYMVYTPSKAPGQFGRLFSGSPKPVAYNVWGVKILRVPKTSGGYSYGRQLTTKIVRRYIGSHDPDMAATFEPIAKEALKVHTELQAWLQSFPRDLQAAVEKSDLPEGRVWAKYISDAWARRYHLFLERFQTVADRIQEVGWAVEYLSDDANLCEQGLRLPPKHQYEQVTNTVKHHVHAPPGEGMNWSLSYDVGATEKWYRGLMTWSNQSEGLIKKAMTKARQKIKRRSR